MLSLRKPSADTIRDFLAAQAKLDFTYAAVGATAAVPPAGYVVDHTRIKLGEGRGGLRSGQGCPGALGAVPPGLGGGMAPGDADPGGPGRGGDRPALRPVVAQRLPDRVRRGRGGAGQAVRLRLRHAAGPRRVGRGAVHRRVAPRRTMRSGTTSWPSPARSNSWLGWATPWHGGCKSGSPGIQRRRCGERWSRANQRLR